MVACAKYTARLRLFPQDISKVAVVDDFRPVFSPPQKIEAGTFDGSRRRHVYVVRTVTYQVTFGRQLSDLQFEHFLCFPRFVSWVFFLKYTREHTC